MDSLKTPILLYHAKTDELGVYDSLYHLKTTSREILKSGYFRSLLMLTANGKLYKLTNLREVGYNGLIKGWHPLLKGTMIKIDFEVVEVGEIDLSDIKSKILKKLNNSMYESIVGIEELRGDVKLADNYTDLIDKLSVI